MGSRGGIGLNRVAGASIVEGEKMTQKVLRLGVLRFVLKVVVVDGFGAAEIVNADHKRPEVLKGSDRLQIKNQETHSDERDEIQSNFQVCVCDHRITVLFEQESLCILKGTVIAHGRRPPTMLPTIPTEDERAVPQEVVLMGGETFSG